MDGGIRIGIITFRTAPRLDLRGRGRPRDQGLFRKGADLALDAGRPNHPRRPRFDRKDPDRIGRPEGCCLIVTTGGTGPASRDVTPEATEDVVEKAMPGFGELMRQVSLAKVPTAILSRQTAGIRGRCLIVNLPGRPAPSPNASTR